ncbi:MAG: hypothetical protein M0Z99_26800, partial [Betaproteobacteria bacterium]|nr:hypothetical protein [Betaproteobacteria bacterium]
AGDRISPSCSIRTRKKTRRGGFFCVCVVPLVGIELTTYRLQVSGSHDLFRLTKSIDVYISITSD